MSGKDGTRHRRKSQRGPFWKKAAGKEADAFLGKAKMTLPTGMVFGRPSVAEAGASTHPRAGNGDMWLLLQGAFADEWIQSQAAKGKAAVERHVSASATKASAGHAAGAACTTKAYEEKNAHAQNLFKMPRFRDVPCKVQIPRAHTAKSQS